VFRILWATDLPASSGSVDSCRVCSASPFFGPSCFQHVKLLYEAVIKINIGLREKCSQVSIFRQSILSGYKISYEFLVLKFIAIFHVDFILFFTLFPTSHNTRVRCFVIHYHAYSFPSFLLLPLIKNFSHLFSRVCLARLCCFPSKQNHAESRVLHCLPNKVLAI
jgi:hypothetical protein